MKVLVIDGNPRVDRFWDVRLAEIADELAARGHVVDYFRLRGTTIRQCIGCFSCWVRTPGVCVFDDCVAGILRAALASDLALFASPLVLGFPSALMKTLMDRLIPILLPYVETSTGECRHPLRYGRTPAMALLLAPEEDTDEEDLRIVEEIWRRVARNAHSSLAFLRMIDDPVEEVCHAVDRL